MRGIEALLGGLLLVSGAAIPGLGFLEEDPTSNESVMAEAIFEEADYAGPAEVTADDGALWSEGSLEATITAEQVTVERYEWEGAHLDTWTGQEEGPWVSTHHGAGTVERSTTTYENATVEIDTEPGAILSAWANASRGETQFTAQLAADSEPAIAASPSGTTLWTKYAGFNHHVEGPLFALGHNEGRVHDVWVQDATIETLASQGALDLNVLGGTLTVDDGEQRDTYDTGVEKQTKDAGVHESTVTTKRVHALVYVTNATFETSMAQAESVLLAQEPTWSLNGSLQVDAERGEVRTGAQNATLNDDPLTLLGNTTLDLAAQGETPDPSGPQPHLEDEPPRAPIESQIESEGESVRVDGQSLAVPEKPAIPEEVTFWGKVLGLLMLAVSFVKKVPPFLIGLLARDPLNNDRRRRIHRFVEEAGMAHVRLIARALGIPVSSALYHLRVLHEADALVKVKREGYTVYFACDEFEIEDKKRLALLASETRATIAEHLAEAGGATQDALAEALGISQPTVSKQLCKLEDDALVEGNGSNGIVYRPSELLESWFSARERTDV
jgi:predicted transcriptional regulator